MAYRIKRASRIPNFGLRVHPRRRFNDGPRLSGVSGDPLALFPIPRGLSQLHVRCPVHSAFDSAAGTGNPPRMG